MSSDQYLLEGFLSIQAAIESGWREVHQVLIDENKRYDGRLSALRKQADAAGIAVSYVPGETVDQLSSGGSHGGALAQAGERRFCELSDLLPKDAAAFIVMLDGIEDPYNFAGAIRALYAAGADGVVLRPRNWTGVSARVGRASVGTIERLPLAIAESAAEAADFFRGYGLKIAATSATEGARFVFRADLSAPFFC